MYEWKRQPPAESGPKKTGGVKKNPEYGNMTFLSLPGKPPRNLIKKDTSFAAVAAKSDERDKKKAEVSKQRREAAAEEWARRPDTVQIKGPFSDPPGQQILILGTKGLDDKRKALLSGVIVEARKYLQLTHDAATRLLDRKATSSPLKELLQQHMKLDADDLSPANLRTFRTVVGRALAWFDEKHLVLQKLPMEKKKKAAESGTVLLGDTLLPANNQWLATRSPEMSYQSWLEKTYRPWSDMMQKDPEVADRPALEPIRMRLYKKKPEKYEDEEATVFNTLVHEITHATSFTDDVAYRDEEKFPKLTMEEHLANADSYAVLLDEMRRRALKRSRS